MYKTNDTVKNDVGIKEQGSVNGENPIRDGEAILMWNIS